MMMPKIEGYKVSVVGDDIAWLQPDNKGQLRAINPENGFFGVAPGTSFQSNPIAMQTIFKDTIFSNVAMTPDGGVWWEGMGENQRHASTGKESHGEELQIRQLLIQTQGFVHHSSI